MSYPPPADDAYSNQQPPQAYGQQPYAQPVATFASWGARVGGYLIDMLTLVPFYALAFLLGMGTDETTGLRTPNALYWVFVLLAVVVAGYNRWFQGGKTGQTWGRKALGIKLVGETTGQPIGVGAAFVRDLAHILDGIPCYIGYLFPLWDAKKQTFADKITKTVVVR